VSSRVLTGAQTVAIGTPEPSASWDRFIHPSPVHRAAPGALTAAGCLGGAAVHGHVGQLQADHLLVGVECGQPKPVEDPQGDPLVPAAVQGGGRGGGGGDPFVSGAEDQRLDEPVEHHRVVSRGGSEPSTCSSSQATHGSQTLPRSTDGDRASPGIGTGPWSSAGRPDSLRRPAHAGSRR
jgi:hypothetical protein